MSSKYTARGTLRLTKAQRSSAMKRAWKTRRIRYGLAAKPKRKGPPDPKRSKALRRAWRRRWKAGTAPKRQKRVLLTPTERSEIAIAAAQLRQKRLRAAERKRKQAAKKRRATLLQRRQEALAQAAAEAARKATAARKRKRKAAERKRQHVVPKATYSEPTPVVVMAAQRDPQLLAAYAA